MPYRNIHTDEIISDRAYYGLYEDEQDDYEKCRHPKDFSNSLIIGAVTGSALLGGIIGGDITGGIVGDLLDGDLMD